jgi:hypothetical protein
MEIVILSLVVTGIATIVAANSYRVRKKAFQKKIRKPPFKRIAFVENGETVTIAGNIVPHKRLIEAPLSDRSCVFYHATVEQQKSSGKSSEWVKEIDEISAVPFLLDDGDFLALIDVNTVIAFLEMDARYRSGTFNVATPKLEAYLKKYKLTSKGTLGFNKSLRYKEGSLEKHEYCVVSGTCYWEKAADHEIDGPEEILVIKSSKNNPIYISDIKDILI